MTIYVDDYMEGRIKKHELPRRDKEEDRMKHVRINNANIEPVFFAFPDNKALEGIDVGGHHYAVLRAAVHCLGVDIVVFLLRGHYPQGHCRRARV